MADNDPYGLWGESATEDKYGLWGGQKPRPSKPRSRRARADKPEARDIEQPSSPTSDEELEAAPETEDRYGLMPRAKDADLKQGPPPGAASARGPGWQRPTEPAWYEPLLDSTRSFLQGATGNLGDEATAAALAAGDYLGISKSGNSYAENADLYKKDADRVTRAYPYGHGAGQMATGMAASMAAAPGKLAQGATQGALSAASEYADSRDPNDPWGTAKRTGKAALLGGLSGVAGSWIGSKFARAGATSPDKALKQELRQIWDSSPVPDPEPRLLPRPEPAPPPIPESGPPRPLPSPSGRPYDPLAAQTSAAAPRAPISETPRPLPVESAPGGYDPLAAQQMAVPRGAPRPQPVPESAPPSELEELLGQSIAQKGGGGPRVLRGSDGKLQKILPMELDMSPAPKLPSAPAETPYGPGPSEWYFDLPADANLSSAPRPRVGGVPPEPAPPSSASEYLLGDVPAPGDALPRPRLGGPAVAPEAVPEYPLGDVDLAPPSRPPSMPSGGERELQQIALNRARQNMPTDNLGAALKAGSGMAAMLGQPQAAAGLRAGAMLSKLRQPGVRDFAVQSGELIPNQAWGAAGRMGSEMAWELGAPGVTGSKVNAQDADHVAYADAPTLNYALSETLHAGNTGLSPQDEQTLTSAVVKGDDQAIAATDFRLRQRYPAYARAVEKRLRGLNEGDD